MAVLKKRREGMPGPDPGFGSLMHGDRPRILGLGGKRVVFAVDDKDHEMEALGLGHIIRSQTEASGDSGIVKYSEFLAAEGLRADVLILRSSGIFPDEIGRLRTAVESFRRGNPNSAVILCVYDPEVYRKVADLADSGAVDSFYRCPPDDPEMLELGAGILERLGRQNQRQER